MADEAYRIGPPPSRESYLRAEALVELAVAIGADAIHPGYGFLSENARFAALCEEAGVELHRPAGDRDRRDGQQDREPAADASRPACRWCPAAAIRCPTSPPPSAPPRRSATR